MKKRITFLMAAITLLAFLAIPMGVWGQSDYSSDYTGNITLSTEGGANASTCVISISNTNYNGIKAGTSSKAGAVMISVPSGTKYLHIHAAAWNGTTCSLTVTPEGYSDAIALTTNSGIANNSPFTFNGNANTSDYYKVITFSSALTSDTNLTFTATGGKRFVIWGVTSEEEGSSDVVATPTFSPAAGTYTQAQNVSINCSTDGATIYYTTNGNDPTTNSSVYSGAINVSTNTTIKAMATAEGYDNSAIATAEYAFITLEHAGTLEDPYTVADARAAIDANAGTQGVYATGIVSAIPTAWNSQYSNITFDFVDNAGDTDVLEAYRCASGTGVDASQVAVGDVVVVYGNLTKYGSTYEFGQGCTLVSLTHPAITTPVVTVTPNTINASAEGADGTLALTYENIEEFISFDYYFCDANGNELEDTDPDYPGDWIYAEINEPGEEENYTLSYIIDANDGEARTAYVKVYTFDDNLEEVYAIVTVNQAAYEAPNVTWNLSIDETATATEDEMTWTSDYATMAVEKGTSSTNTNNYYPGTSGHNYTSTRFYTGSVLTIAPVVGYAITSVEFTATTTGYASALMNSTWTNATASAEGTTVTITPSSGSGAIQATIGATCGFTQVKVYYEQHQAETYDLTISLNENIPFIFVFDANDQNNPLIEDGAAGTVQVLEGTSILVSPDVAEGYVLETLMVNNENVISQLDESGAYTFEMPAENVTISATAVEDVPPTPGNMYVKVTSTNDLTSGQYLIVYEEGNVAFNGGLETLDAAGNTIDVTIQDDEIAVTTETAAAEFTIDMAAGTIMSASGLYIGQTSDANGMQSSAETAYTNTISIDEDYNAVVVSSSAHLRYNNASNQNRFRYYKSTSYEGQKAIQLYKKVETLPANTIVIEGYGESEGGYYLIASPFTVSPEDVQGMTEGEYDLYSFDEAEENEWRNYKAGAFTNLEPGKGYLYAHSTTVTLTFDGEAYNGDPIVLKKTAGCDFEGWNLVGNPYTGKAYIDRDFYVMNPQTGDEIITGEGNEIAAMQGFFVIADHDGEELEISTEPTEEGGKIVMNVNSNRGNIIDRAMVRFGEGRQLPKFMLNEDNTKLYIAKGEEEYAVARNEAKGEMNLNFEAAKDGTYTLDFTVENVELDQLLLIDDKTGVSIDLLSTQSYTFEATTDDAAARFRIVFGATTSVQEENINKFAFYNNGNLIINNNGNAILNIVDVLGRIISSHNINGSENVSINAKAGVYMLQLIQGDKIQTQKIVVE